MNCFLSYFSHIVANVYSHLSPRYSSIIHFVFIIHNWLNCSLIITTKTFIHISQFEIFQFINEIDTILVDLHFIIINTNILNRDSFNIINPHLLCKEKMKKHNETQIIIVIKITDSFMTGYLISLVTSVNSVCSTGVLIDSGCSY